MRKVLLVFLIMLFTVSMFSFIKAPILNENMLFEFKGNIKEKSELDNSQFFYLTLESSPDTRIVFPNNPNLYKWFEENTTITVYGYFVVLKNGKYFVPVKIIYNKKTIDLRKEIAKRLYLKKKKDMYMKRYYKNFKQPYSPMYQKYQKIPHQMNPYYPPQFNNPYNQQYPNYPPKPYNKPAPNESYRKAK